MLASCGAAASPNEAFNVEGTSVSITDFDAITESLVDIGELTAANGSITGDDARSVMKQLIQFRAAEHLLDSLGASVTEADRQSILDQAKQDPNFQQYPKTLQDLLIDLNVIGVAVNKVQQPSSSDLRSMYEKSPASTGALCLSHILLKTEADARDALDELDRGADFADVAKKSSTEPGTDSSGGSLGNGDEECQLLETLQTSFDRDFMIGAVAAKPGVPTGPVKTQFGYHVILSRPWSEVGDSVASVTSEGPGMALLTGYMATADITVNSRYGTWVGAVGSIN